MGIFNEIITKIGEELGIKVTLLSENWLTVLEKEGKIHFIQGYKFDLNSHGIGNVLDDKGLFYDVLKYKKLPIIEHHVLFHDYDKQEVLDYFHKNNNELIIKGNIGTSGEQVFKVNSEQDLFTRIDKLFLNQFSLSLCPYYQIKNEYRVIVLNNEARIIFGKVKPKVIGDGLHTVKELACSFNKIYEVRPELLENPEMIPPKGEAVELNYQFNLSRGATMFIDIDKDLKEQLIALALLVSKSVNITFGSIDIIKTVNDELLIMEANSGVMMDNYIRFNGDKGYRDAYNLYKDAIKMMFEV